MGSRIILTGATGMVGEGVLRQCLLSKEVDQVLIIGRKSSGVKDPRVSEIIVPDLETLPAEELPGEKYDACLFCLGVSSVGLNEEQYTRLTYDLTIRFATLLRSVYPGLTFCYISGSGTDSTEKGRTMWARVKGRTENRLMEIFSKAYMFRPGFMKPDPGARNTLSFYRYVNWLYPVLRRVFPKYTTTLAELGRAMVRCAVHGHERKVIEVPDIVALARKQ